MVTLSQQIIVIGKTAFIGKQRAPADLQQRLMTDNVDGPGDAALKTRRCRERRLLSLPIAAFVGIGFRGMNSDTTQPGLWHLFILLPVSQQDRL